MPDKVLVYSRFPKTLMVRIGERFELMDAGGKSPREVFSAEQLADLRAMIAAGGTPLGPDIMDTMPKLAAIVCYGTGYDGVDLAAAASRGIMRLTKRGQGGVLWTRVCRHYNEPAAGRLRQNPNGCPTKRERGFRR